MLTWTPERIATLTDMWSSHTAAQIADALSVTRSAVLGKLNRLKLLKGREQPTPEELERRRERRRAKNREWARNNRARLSESQRRWREQNPDRVAEIERRYRERHRQQIRERNRRFRTAKAAADRANRLTDLRMLPTDTPPAERINIADIALGQCRWPYEGQMFCGKPTELHRSYCPHHHGRAYL